MPVRGPTEKPAPSGRCIAGASLPQPYSTCSPCDMVFSGPAPHGLRMWQSHTGFLLAGVSQPADHGLPVEVSCRAAVLTHCWGRKQQRMVATPAKIHTKEQHVVSYFLLGQWLNADQLQRLVRQLHRSA